MIDDDWTMADGFAPVSRLHYCEHPKACSAPRTGHCPRCQKRVRANPHRVMRKSGGALMTADSTPTFVDEDFDSWGAQ